jgi:hypothetical protein
MSITSGSLTALPSAHHVITVLENTGEQKRKTEKETLNKYLND